MRQRDAVADSLQQTSSNDVGRYAAFLVAGRRFAVPASMVIEVLRDGRVSTVPRAPVSLAGLLNLRGRIVPVVNLQQRLGLAVAPNSPTAAPPGVHIVIQNSDEWCSLLVDKILDVVEIPASDFEPVVAQEHSEATSATTSVYAAEEGLYYLLAVSQVLSPPTTRIRPPQRASHS